MECEPGIGEGEIEPAGAEEMKNEGGQSGGEKQTGLGGKLRIRQSGMKKEQGEAGQEEKAGEIVALEQGQGTKRHPIAQKINHGERDGDNFEEDLRKRGKMLGRGLGRSFVAEGFANEWASQQDNAAEAEYAAEDVGAGRNSRTTGKMEHVRGPVL